MNIKSELKILNAVQLNNQKDELKKMYFSVFMFIFIGVAGVMFAFSISDKVPFLVLFSYLCGVCTGFGALLYLSVRNWSIIKNYINSEEINKRIAEIKKQI